MCFKTNGNPYLIASLECLCRQAIGQKLETLQVNHQELINLLEIPFNQVPLVMQVEQVYKEVVRLMNKKLKGES
jgi:nitrogen fixation NifU-like protein